MPNDDFLHSFVTWLASVGQTYHIAPSRLYRWRKLTPGAKHKRWGIPDAGEAFTDGAVVIAMFTDAVGFSTSAFSNWDVPKPIFAGRRKLSSAKKTKEQAPGESRKKRPSSALHLLDDL